MALQLPSRRRALPVRVGGLSAASREALLIAFGSRLMVFLTAFFASLTFVRVGVAGRNARLWDVPGLSHPFGNALDLLFSPLARWDAIWYLSIAGTGYNSIHTRDAFFPLYPLLVRVVGELGGAIPGALLVASYVVSLLAFAGAIVLLQRLVELELGRELSRATLILLCVFPASLFFGAPYSESVFLLVSVGAIYAARTGHWAWAGLLAAAGASARSTGIFLIVPLLIFYIWGPRMDRPDERPRYRIRPDAAWLLLAPVGLAAYAGYLWIAQGDPSAFMGAQAGWFRHFGGPLGAVWAGLAAGFDAVKQLLSTTPHHHHHLPAAIAPLQQAGLNLILLGFLVFAVVASVGTLRRLPKAYGAYVIASLLLPLSYPVKGQPLMSLPRFLAVLFPLFMWLALVSERRRLTPWVAAAFALGLGWFVTQFATWNWVA